MKSHTKRIMVVAGEASGDAHAAKLIMELREARTDINFEFFGAVSHKLRAAGVESVVNSDDLSIVGLPEIARALPVFLKAFRALTGAADVRKPDAVILVDFPEFNLKLAKALKKKGLTVIYYISPQLWAWRKYRVRTIRKYVDLVISILPFEKDWYAGHGISHVEYVGSPLAMEVYADTSKEDFCRKHSLDPTRPIVSLLPGSRHKEITMILPVMLEAAALMAEKDASLQFVIALASDRNTRDVEAAIVTARNRGLQMPDVLLTLHNETYDALNASDVAAVTSGTATLEAGIIGTPHAIVYKTSVFNYKLMRPLIDVEHFGLINLIAEKRIAKEFIQTEFTPEKLSTELFRLLDPVENAASRKDLNEAADKLGHGGASKRAAEALLRLIENR